jgi:transcriptional regulator with XRE-family HTH domain
MADKNEIQVADWLAEDYAELQTDPDYVTQGILIDIAVQLGEIMDEEGIESQKELADCLDMSPSAVSQIMSGDQNMSIERLVRIALALGRTLEAPRFVNQQQRKVTPIEPKHRRVHVEAEATHAQGFSQKRRTGGSWTFVPGQPAVQVFVGDQTVREPSSSGNEMSLA